MSEQWEGCEPINRTCKTPLEDLRKSDLEHYDKASTKIHHWSSGVPRAINFYFDYKQMNFWSKIKLAFKN
tara:strand:- start:49 stop:258 length:210 start_codon:yes stop_codon:yes gene_type:complete